ncbi:MAG: hypothetical protein JWO18_1184 [Microbacteriaceae bacterium]|nr:hypothetical protein [Microbacteriaceae bacterium]
MNCTYCGTELPPGALFCGECGRAVAPASGSASPRVARPPDPEAVVSQPSLDEPPMVRFQEAVLSPDPEVAADPGSRDDPDGFHCTQCGAPMSANDIFCGECGHVSREISEGFSRPRDTIVIEPLEALAFEASLPRPPKPEIPAPARRPVRSEQAPLADSGDMEATRIVNSSRTGGRFILQFSTGETFTVYGTGLVGRNPQPEPGEFFDQLVRVLDPSRSVSKTHLEFGQESGAFWIKDRFSGNGTIVREPDSDPIRCQPEKRVRVVRGTRVDIGEQFFIVS